MSEDGHDAEPSRFGEHNRRDLSVVDSCVADNVLLHPGFDEPTFLACQAANHATEHSTNIQASVTTGKDTIVLCDLPIESAVDAMADEFLLFRLTDGVTLAF